MGDRRLKFHESRDNLKERGDIDSELDSEMLALAIAMTTLAPRILPQLTRMITGLDPTDREFNIRFREFHRQLGDALRPRTD